ncbi:MAG: hypothetical protein HY744_32460 [Deltaproteobacteria bacterium]|nr:hypothetical protein [Deltaproteobacteria bacterium]
MSAEALRERLRPILEAPHELAAYQRWLGEERRAAGERRDYLYAQERPRFEPRREDVVVALPGVRVQGRQGGVRLQCDEPAADVALPGVSRRDVERLLAAMDGRRCLLEVRWEAAVSPAALAAFLRSSFGLLVLAPRAVEALEARLAALEVSRFPSSPYGVERPYWENTIAVREHFTACMEPALASGAELLALLRELHVLALMGPSLQSFYRPASPVADRPVAPGALFLSPARLLRRPGAAAVFLDGPRVGAPLLGGEPYHRELCRSLGDPDALGAERELELDGLPWGGVVTARSEKDERPGPWFIPPRPIRPEHFDWLARELGQAAAAAARAARPELVRAAARWHWGFVRLHPFHCANQSLAMNLVNAQLARSHGAGIPHLVLDQLALRLSAPAYEEAFRRATDAFLVAEPDPARRLSLLRQRWARASALVGRASAATGEADLGELCAADPEAARWALLRP